MNWNALMRFCIFLSPYSVLHGHAEVEAVVQLAAQPYPVCSGSAPYLWGRRIPRSLDTLGRCVCVAVLSLPRH